MRLLRQCDLFRVVQDTENHLTPATPYGAAVSIATTAVLLVLLISELYGYCLGHKNCHITPSAFKNTLDAEVQRTLDRLHFSISLPYMPCHRVATETMTALGHDMPTEQDTKVWLYHIPYGSYAADSPAAYLSSEELSEEERGCLIKGTAPIAPRPASFNIILRDYRVEESGNYRPEFQIHHLSAGNAYDNWAIPQIRRQTLEPMSGFKSAQSLQRPYFYQFFLQLIPTTVSVPSEDDRFGYQYTAFHSVQEYNGRGRAPGLYLAYKLSPFAMDCVVQYDTISHFVVHLCAVVGGVYTVAGMVEAGLEWLARQRRLREVSARNHRNAQALQSTAGEAPIVR
ncbi:hypothetical protein GH5_01373 [Leishmania sp. Ghana 2012 LV757]|uniref:Endoplasmic reticulum vesicle transporter C-terminal domain-containing protein n=1 Tax=Leishmania orientalis TaxID=2249476 RepID=A0A836GB03_9TRYP|nr:hypothetical protein LSCM4_03119 [Leishmania orientalis]KAG5496867.1 hypothetical protein GH5_01373 [Leishmania sp. Ghana 2012 LV757]